MAQGINELGYATLTVSNAAAGVSLTADASTTLPAKCKRAYITCRTDAVSWRADGTAPVAVTDHILAANDSLSFMSSNFRQVLEQILFIRDTNDATLQITYFD